MKKIKTWLVVIMLVFGFCGASWYGCHYTLKDCKVLQVNDGVATIESCTGDYWDVKVDNTISTGDTVKLKMFTNHTDNNIKDDKVINVIRVD